jgi:hypothetical protein
VNVIAMAFIISVGEYARSGQVGDPFEGDGSARGEAVESLNGLTVWISDCDRRARSAVIAH